jgi:hypothetical protein
MKHQWEKRFDKPLLEENNHYNHYVCKRCGQIAWQDRNEIGKFWRKHGSKLFLYSSDGVDGPVVPLDCDYVLMRKAIE